MTPIFWRKIYVKRMTNDVISDDETNSGCSDDECNDSTVTGNVFNELFLDGLGHAIISSNK